MTLTKYRAKNKGKEPRTHGVTGYDYWGCRCEICSEASRHRRRALIEKRKLNRQAIPPEIHGKYTTYTNWVCRCTPCRDDWARYRAEMRNR